MAAQQRLPGPLNVDVKLWVFLQNVIHLNRDYLKETEEYDAFKVASQQETGYVISKADLYSGCGTAAGPAGSAASTSAIYTEYIHFDTFSEMISNIKAIYEESGYTNTLKYKLLARAIPIMEMIAVENSLDNMNLKF